MEVAGYRRRQPGSDLEAWTHVLALSHQVRVCTRRLLSGDLSNSCKGLLSARSKPGTLHVTFLLTSQVTVEEAITDFISGEETSWRLRRSPKPRCKITNGDTRLWTLYIVPPRFWPRLSGLGGQSPTVAPFQPHLEVSTQNSAVQSYQQGIANLVFKSVLKSKTQFFIWWLPY